MIIDPCLINEMSISKTVVISQSMYFPWIGLIEQLKLADVFVHYDDVQFSKGGFTNRVQIKSPQGVRWMTIPVLGGALCRTLMEIIVDNRQNWRVQHQRLLYYAYGNAPFFDDMMDIVLKVHGVDSERLCDISRSSMLELANYFNVIGETNFVDSTTLGVTGSGSNRVLDIVRLLGGSRYVTGHGAKNYLDHHCFDEAAIDVEYMDYRCMPYRQLHGDFTPYVSSLDLVAHLGPHGREIICSPTKSWRDFLNYSHDDKLD